MTITKRAELDMIGFDVGNDPVKQGQVSLRWRKMTYDGEKLAATEYHRMLIDADADLDASLEAVAADLERQGFGRPPDADRPYIDAAINLAWTPEVKAAVAADREQRRQEEEAAAAAAKSEHDAAVIAEQKRFDDAVASAINRVSKR